MSAFSRLIETPSVTSESPHHPFEDQTGRLILEMINICVFLAAYCEGVGHSLDWAPHNKKKQKLFFNAIYEWGKRVLLWYVVRKKAI